MKAKKILLLLAGILNTVAGAFVGGLGLLVLLTRKLMRTLFNDNYEYVEQFIDEMTKQDSSYSYLKEYTKSESIEYIMSVLGYVILFMVIVGIILLVFGILNIMLSKRLYVLQSKKSLGILLVTFSWIIITLNPMNILTTIGVFLKPKNKDAEQKLYTRNEEKKDK